MSNAKPVVLFAAFLGVRISVRFVPQVVKFKIQLLRTVLMDF